MNNDEKTLKKTIQEKNPTMNIDNLVFADKDLTSVKVSSPYFNDSVTVNFKIKKTNIFTTGFAIIIYIFIGIGISSLIIKKTIRNKKKRNNNFS
ncbi:hypothetical protein ['Camptotheca acuminata' phytoplasma]|uniref:hypothetical protein n=1 Tax='Camptotheca acuminata' phytoplasma TaxID=3239192 RepID=UPI00351A694C